MAGDYGGIDPAIYHERQALNAIATSEQEAASTEELTDLYKTWIRGDFEQAAARTEQPQIPWMPR